jgi:hypothetical protein
VVLEAVTVALEVEDLGVVDESMIIAAAVASLPKIGPALVAARDEMNIRFLCVRFEWDSPSRHRPAR